MTTYVPYTPEGPIAKAMFNFDAFGWTDYQASGTIRVSVSDAFSFSDYLGTDYSDFWPGLYTSSGSEEVAWTPQMTANVQDILGIYSQFANLPFQWVGDSDGPVPDATPNPEDVGRAGMSDIDITWVYRTDSGYAGLSGGNKDGLLFDYAGGAGDIFLNQAAAKFDSDFTLDLNTRARQTLMHELGHSLGLSHPHTSYSSSSGATLSADYAATQFLGFEQLGFHIDSSLDMYKEYFTIMSYDDQQSFLPGSTVLFHAHTPMILDVIALQEAYGEGSGTSGTGNDTIVAGDAGYRTYFDKGGADTIDLSVYYTAGAYLHMGANITGAPHLVGVSMSLYDAYNTVVLGGDPAHLRWYYGEYENAIGSSNADALIGNALGNVISGQGSDDLAYGNEGDDSLLGGDGNDFLQGNQGSDTLRGSLGNDDERGGNHGDFLYSGQGDDTLVGALGNDELHGGPNDDLLSSGQGNDTLYGGPNDDLMQGRAGNDSLIGGPGIDHFWFNASGTSTADVISDFDPLEDLIELDSSAFAALAPGPLDPSLFQAIVLYDQGTGALSYDANGGEHSDAFPIATLTNHAALMAGDMLVV